MNGTGFDRGHHFHAWSEMQIFESGAGDDGGKRKAGYEVHADERAHREPCACRLSSDVGVLRVAQYDM